MMTRSYAPILAAPILAALFLAPPALADSAAPFKPGANRPTPPLSPVTEEMLDDPADGAWLTHRGDRRGWGYSKLDQITRENVHRLRYVWSSAVDPQRPESNPLIHDGVMFLNQSGDVIQALDAATGERYWTYARALPEGLFRLSQVNRNIAIFGDKIFTGTADAHLVALDARTGEVVWDREIADHEGGHHYSGGPIIADGKVIAGISGCYLYAPGGCWVSAHDPDSGEEIWRVNTIEMPGDNPSDSWGGAPADRRFGGSVWVPPTYDAETGLLYVGVAVAIPWGRVQRAGQGDLLYTNSTLAVDVKTGEIRWYRQHLPNDNLDMDHAFERIVVTADVRPDPAAVRWINPDAAAGERDIIVGAFGKTGIVQAFDKASGEFLWARETVEQNVITELDLATGRQTQNPALANSRIGETVTMCPSFYGGKHWAAEAYNPTTGVLVVPLNNSCMNYTLKETKVNIGGYHFSADYSYAPVPGGSDQIGRLEAIDVSTGTTLWKHEQRAPFFNAALATAGGVVFTGGVDGVLKAFDDRSGEVLWRVKLNTGLESYPATYMVDGRQYLVVGTGGVVGFTQLTPEIERPHAGSIFVFALDDAGTGGPNR